VRHPRGSLALAAGLAALVGCSGGGSVSGPRFSGGTGAAWEVLPATPPGTVPGFSDYSPAGKRYFFQLQHEELFRYDGAFTALAGPPDDAGEWPGTAWIGDALYLVRNKRVYAYSIPGDSWQTLLDVGVPATGDAQLAHDDDGNLWTVEAEPPHRIVRYDLAGNAAGTFDSGGLGGEVFEPRVAWDALTGRLFIAPSYARPLLYAFDPATGEVAPRASVLAAAGGAGTGMGTAFCSDRSGHLYAAGDTGCNASATMFQYDTRDDSWKRIPDVPFADHGCNGACTVTDDGWLYFQGGGVTGYFSRLKLE
jgi:hypothetical protein